MKKNNKSKENLTDGVNEKNVADKEQSSVKNSHNVTKQKGETNVVVNGDVNGTVNVYAKDAKLKVNKVYFEKDSDAKDATIILEPVKRSFRSDWVNLSIKYGEFAQLEKTSENFTKLLKEHGIEYAYNEYFKRFSNKYLNKKYSLMATSLENSCKTGKDGETRESAKEKIKEYVKGTNGKNKFFVFLSAITNANTAKSKSLEYHIARILKELLKKRKVEAFWWEDEELRSDDWYVSTKIATGLALSSVFIGLAFDTVEMTDDNECVNFVCFDDKKGSPCFKYEVETFKSFCEKPESHKVFVKGFYDDNINYGLCYPETRQLRVFSYGKPENYKGCNRIFDNTEYIKEVKCYGARNPSDRATQIIREVLKEIYNIINNNYKNKFVLSEDFGKLDDSDLEIINKELQQTEHYPANVQGNAQTWEKQMPCEYYFEYKTVASADNNIDNCQKPFIFVECDKDGEYRLCAEIPDWRCGDGSELDDLPDNPQRHDFEKLAKNKKFTKVKCEFAHFNPDELKNDERINEIAYNMFGSNKDLSELNKGKDCISIEADYADYCTGNRRIEISSSAVSASSAGNKKSKAAERFNGFGKISLMGNGAFAEYAFFVNFHFRKRIVYQFDRLKNKIIIYENGLEKSDNNITVSLRNKSDSKNYDGLCKYNVKRKTKELPLTVTNNADSLFLVFDNKENEKKYLLEQMTCKQVNTSIRTQKLLKAASAEEIVCPYCHRKIMWDSDNATLNYYNGGVTCRGERAPIFIAGGTNGNKYIVCDECFADGKIKNGSKLLPENFLNADSFRIAVIGSTRSGKTFWLSRLFRLGAHGVIALDQTPLNKFIKDKASNLMTSECGLAFNDNEFTAAEWDDKFAAGFQWDIKSGRCPTPTKKNKDDSRIKDLELDYLESRPLTLKFNKSTRYFIKKSNKRAQYVHIYDMPGESFLKQEDNKPIENLPLVDNPNRLGAFFILNDSGEFNNPEPRERLYNTFNEFLTRMREKKANKIPLAIVVTKFDKYENEFDSNSHCLRSDILEMTKFVSVNGKRQIKYDGSALQNNIDMASKEIEIFLREKLDDPNKKIFDLIKNNEFSGNIRFFGVSALGLKQSLFHTERGGEKNVLQFYASPKRTELPFIWMLHEFGIID